MLSCNRLGSGVRRQLMKHQLIGYTYNIHINNNETTSTVNDVANGHIDIWNNMEQDKWYVVIEDDIIINSLYITADVDDSIDMISLYRQGIHHSVKHCDNYSIIKSSSDYKIKNHGLCGYYIKSTYAKELAQGYKYDQPIDHYVYDKAQDNQLVTNRHQITHKTGWSVRSKALV